MIDRWPEPVERVARFARETGAEVRIEQLRAELRGVEGERELARIVVGA